MNEIFISHSSADNQAAAEMAAWLQEKRFEALFLDFDPEKGIPAGCNWEKELYRRLRTCRAVIVLCSERSMRSDWCFAEITHARALGKHLFPVKISPCRLRHPLDQLQAVDMAQDRQEAYERLWQGLLKADLDPVNQFQWDRKNPPYPGLMAFQERDAAVFFGRDDDIRRGLDRLNNLRLFGGPRLLLVLGASGSGKSSLVRAGLVPRLKRDPAAWLVVEPIRSRGRPFAELAGALREALANQNITRDAADISSSLRAAAKRSPPDPSVLFDLNRDLTTAARQAEAAVVLVLDQLEEFLAPEAGEEAVQFLSFLRAGLEGAPSPFLVVATLRSDFLGTFQNHPTLRGLASRELLVGPLTVDGYARVIEGPAEVAGWKLEAGLTERMVADTTTEDALPLLAFTLRELWERTGQQPGEATIDDYASKLGGLAGSVQRAADAVMSAQPLSPEQTEALRRAFLAMARINEEGQYARQPARWENLPQSSHPILGRFVEKRLLVSGKDDGMVEVAHEALLRHWPVLKAWLDGSREFLLWKKRLAAALEEHTHSGTLLRDAALTEAERWLRERGSEIEEPEKRFIERSLAQRQAETEAARKRRQKIIVALVAGILVTTCAAVLALWQRNLADTQRGVAERATATAKTNENRALESAEQAQQQRRVALEGLARFLASASEKAGEAQPQLRLLLAAEAVRATREVDGTVTTFAENALREALTGIGGRPLPGFEVLSGDGKFALLIDDAGVARLQSLEDPRVSDAVLDVGNAKWRKSALSRTGRWLALADGRPSTLRLWQMLAAGPKDHTLSLPKTAVTELAFSPDEQWLMAAGDDAIIRLWRLSDPQAEPVRLTAHSKSATHDGKPLGILRAEFSPNGRWLLSIGWDDTARLWEMDRLPSESKLLLQDVSIPTSPCFTADGRWLTLSRRDTLTRASDTKTLSERFAVWKLVDMGLSPVELARGSTSASRTVGSRMVGLDSEARWLVTATPTNVQVWNLTTPQPEPRLIAGYQAAMTSDGQRLAVVAQDKDPVSKEPHVIEVWRVSEMDDRPKEVGAFKSVVRQLSFSPDGGHLAVILEDGSPWLLDLSLRVSSAVFLGGRENPTQSAEFSADGRWLITSGWDKDARLWQVRNPSTEPIIFRNIRRSPELEARTPFSRSAGDPIGGLPAALAFDPLSRWMAAPAQSNAALLCRLDDPHAPPRVLGGHDGQVCAIVFSPAGEWVATADRNHQAKLWSLTNLDSSPIELRRRETETYSSVSAIAVSSDGRWLATGGAEGQVALWDTRQPGESPKVLTAPRAWITSIQFSPDNARLLTAAANGEIRLWNLTQPEGEPVVLRVQSDYLRAVFSGDGRWIGAAGRGAIVRFWNTADLSAEPLAFHEHKADVPGLAASEDGRCIVSGSEDGTVRVWNCRDSAIGSARLATRDPPGASAPIYIVAVSRDGKRIAAGDWTGAVRLWDESTNRLTRSPVTLAAGATGRDNQLREASWALRFSPDGLWLAALTSGKAKLWRVRVEEQWQIAGATAGRNLSLTEWEQHFSEPYRLTFPQWGVHPELLYRATRMARQGDIEAATALFQQAKDLAPGLPIDPRAEAIRDAVEEQLDLGRRYARQGKTNEALAELHKIMRLDPTTSLQPQAEVERIITAQRTLIEADRLARTGDLPAATTAFERARTLDSDLDFDPAAKARLAYAPVLHEEAAKLARAGRLAEAIAMFKKALELVPNRFIELEQHAKVIRSHALKEEAQKLADNGELKPALEKYQAALALNPKLEIKPEDEARKRVAAFNRKEGERLAWAHKIPEAMALLTNAVALDPQVEISAVTWNELCWQGNQKGHAKLVLSAGERAVQLEPDNGGYRDSRGMARALTGDLAGAIADFEAYVEWAPKNRRSPEETKKRHRWISALRAGKQPRTFDELESLGKE